MILNINKLWYTEIIHPTNAKGNEYLNIFSSGNSKFIENKKTKGYINILWYQHNEQGMKFIISEKKRLPNVETKEITKAEKTKVKPIEFDLCSLDEEKSIKIKLHHQLQLLILRECYF